MSACVECTDMINYTERLSLLMEDVVAKVPALNFIDMAEVLVFARPGRTGAYGAYATCHCLNLPTSEPGYYFWRDRRSGKITRRSEWFVTKSPGVRIGERPINYMISFALPRFCEQTFEGSRKGHFYPGQPGWVAKLDTVVHELYHIDPDQPGIRRMERSDGAFSAYSHSPVFLENVVRMVREYLAAGPAREAIDFLSHDFKALRARYRGVVGTTFRAYPSYPQRYVERFEPQPETPAARIVPLGLTPARTQFTEDDLDIREFTDTSSRRLIRKGQFQAA